MIIFGILITVLDFNPIGDDGANILPEPNVIHMALRILTCYLFHLGNYKDMGQSFRRLKFLINYPCRFKEGFIFPAFMVTFYQFTSAISSETVNLMFMC